MAIADEFATYLIEKGYEPRSSRHSDFLSLLIIRDLVAGCPLIGNRAAKGALVANLHHHQMVGNQDWQIDIALGTCAGIPIPPTTGDPVRMAEPVIIQIAIELKGVMTEHGKARRNRLRDFDAFKDHGLKYNPRTVIAAFLAMNSADCFYSPLNFGKDLLPPPKRRPEITQHTSVKRGCRQLAKESIDLFRSIHLRNNLAENGLDAVGIIAVEHDNLNLYPDPAKYAAQQRPTIVPPIPPSLSAGDPLSYDSMIQRICVAYSDRFP